MNRMPSGKKSVSAKDISAKHQVAMRHANCRKANCQREILNTYEKSQTSHKCEIGKERYKRYWDTASNPRPNEVDRSIVVDSQKNTVSPDGRTESFLRAPVLKDDTENTKYLVWKPTASFSWWRTVPTVPAVKLPLKEYLLKNLLPGDTDTNLCY